MKVDEISWDDFRSTGLLWWINQQLHLFGIAIVAECDENTLLTERVYPAKVEFRGFDLESNDEGYQKLTEYLETKMPELISTIKKNKIRRSNEK